MPEIGAPHKLTHQDGGNDELDLTGMSPGAHKTTHQDAGSDEISVLGLSGLLGDSQTPLAHKTSHQDGGTDEITVAGLAGQVVFVSYNAKIADINEVDTNKHFLDLQTALTETRNIIAVTLGRLRNSGTGNINTFPNEGIVQLTIDSYGIGDMVIIATGTNRLQYAQTVANDDFDLICKGYIVTGA